MNIENLEYQLPSVGTNEIDTDDRGFMNDKEFDFASKYLEYKKAPNFFQVEHISQVSKKKSYRIVKRFFDLLSSIISLIFLLVPMGVIGIIIKVTSKGPIIYKQERLGKNGKPFMLFKFRSMVNDAEKNGAQWAEQDDDRTTPVGRFLRKTRLDELPQLINIILGHMSIVGPRPERACFYAEFSGYIEGFDQRLCIIPGLTGFAQISGGYDLKPEEKIVYDVFYIKNRSFWFDLKIIFDTITVVFSHNGAR